MKSCWRRGFDGILSGCGTCIDYEGEEIFYKKLDPELMERSVEAFYEADIPALMEGRDWLYMDEDLISRDEYGKYLMQTMKEHIQADPREPEKLGGQQVQPGDPEPGL